MTGKASVQLQGAADVKKAFASLDKDILREVKTITRETADEIRREARSRIPVSIDKSPKNPYPSGTTRKKVFRFIAKDGISAVVGNKWFVARFLEHGTKKMTARPWLFPAWEIVRSKYLSRLSAAVHGVTRSAR